MSKPEIGLSMLFCLGKPFRKMIEQLPKANVTHIEIVDDGLHTLNKQRVSALKKIAQSYGLRYSVHAPFADINIASPSSAILSAMLKRLGKSIAYSSALEAYVWVFHPGIKTGISSFYPGADWLQNLKTVRKLVKIANEYEVKIAIENVPEPYPFLMKNVDDFTRFYDEINEDVDMVLDVGHSNLNKQTEQFLEIFKDRIIHLHLSDNDGTGDQHLGIGKGMVNWKKVADLMKRASYEGVAIVESIEYIDESLKKLEELLY
jgi:sugar phosphate isomerase/epimerase